MTIANSFFRSLGLLIAAVFILSACGGGGGGGSGGVAASSATVGVVLTDNPVEGYDQALATISAIELLGEQEGPVSLYSGPPVTVDLLALRDYQELFSIADDVPPGKYTKIRLWLDGLELIELDDSGAVEKSTDVDLVAKGKVDLNPKGAFLVESGATLFIVLDFDMEKSIKLTFAGKKKKPKLRPVIFVRISDHAPLGRIARIRGIVESVDTANNRFQLCNIERIAQVSIQTSLDGMNRCVLVTTGKITALFGDDGLPIEFTELKSGDPVTIVGRLVRTDAPDNQPGIQPLAAIGLHDSSWSGNWDFDHDWDFDCNSIVNPLAKGSDDDCSVIQPLDSNHKDKDDDCLVIQPLDSNHHKCKDDDKDKDKDKDDDCFVIQPLDSNHHKCKDDDSRFGFAALLIERGVPGTFRIWKGEADSVVDTTTDKFGLALAPGQGFTEGSILPTQLYPKTWIVSRNGGLLERKEIAAGQGAAVDGVINLVDDLTELRAALVVINEESGSGSDMIKGEIIGVDAVGGTITVSTEGGQACINVNAAEILLVSKPGDGELIETAYTNWDIFDPTTGTARHFEVRYGDGMAAGGAWEMGVKDGPAIAATDHMDWASGITQSFSLTHTSATGELTLTMGGNSLVWELVPDESYPKISILAKANNTEGHLTTITNLQLNGAGLINVPLVAGPGQKTGVYLAGQSFSDFTVTGDMALEWSGAAPASPAMQLFIGVADVDESEESKPGTIDDLEPGQQIIAFGEEGSGDCFAADTLIVTVE